MKRIPTVSAVLLLSILLAIGCGQSSSSPQAKDAPPGTNAPPAVADSNLPSAGVQPAAIPANSPPDQVVASFLKALKEGDDAQAESLMTSRARQETAKRNLAVQPPGSPTAKFNIGAVNLLPDKKGAHVHSVWTETDPQGASVSYEIVWALRAQPEGWRVAGMATQVTEQGPQVYLNFEDPDDMLRKWEEAEATLAAQQPAGNVRQASVTNSGSNSSAPR